MKKPVMKSLTDDEVRVAREGVSSQVLSGLPAFRRKPKFEQIVDWLPSLTASEKAKLREMLQ